MAEALSKVVKERREEYEKGERKNDMLVALLGGEWEEDQLSNEQIVDFMVALLVAGYETTSTIITLAVKFLTQTPLALAQLKVIYFIIFIFFIILYSVKVIYVFKLYFVSSTQKNK